RLMRFFGALGRNWRLILPQATATVAALIAALYVFVVSFQGDLRPKPVRDIDDKIADNNFHQQVAENLKQLARRDLVPAPALVPIPDDIANIPMHVTGPNLDVKRPLREIVPVFTTRAAQQSFINSVQASRASESPHR